jgi:hypothetical protein
LIQSLLVCCRSFFHLVYLRLKRTRREIPAVMQRIKCRTLRAGFVAVRSGRTIGHHVMPAEAGESLYDREMKEAAN